jgi:branched-chain amino acid transport system ATP-binding protein/neutral amino acid transport system ATP-binding protein
MLSVEGIDLFYGAAQALRRVSLGVGKGQVTCLLGRNGVGKTSTLRAIVGQQPVAAGKILWEGEDVTRLPTAERARRGIAFVPQEANVFPTMTVRENLEMGGFVEPKSAAPRIEALFARFPILAEKRRQDARTLSGGQRQILAMAMALMVQPRLLLLDEPSAGLSPKAADLLFERIAAIHAEGTAIAMVEQNAYEALMIADTGLVLVDGRTARTGPARQLAGDPEVRRLFLGG